MAYRILKRLFDIGFSFLLLLILSPVLLTIALIILLQYRSNIIFKQQRAGLYGKPFTLFKFRTMSDATDKLGNRIPNHLRISKLSMIIRKLSLDELPQLMNVLKAEISLIGPRPLRIEYLPLYDDIQKRRHEVKPGITGWAQVNGRNAIDWEERFELDVWYVENCSLKIDIKIFFMTLMGVFRCKDVNRSEKITMEPFGGMKLNE